jgi:heme/copper-type cytochrome/quinol oxidase subunit 1
MAFFEQEIHDAPTTFLSKYVFSFDHKVIAKQFLWYGIFFFGIGGMMALMIRWTLAFPGEPFPVIGQLLFPQNWRSCSTRYVCHAFYFAWNYYDFLCNHSNSHWGFWKLLYSLNDWR